MREVILQITNLFQSLGLQGLGINALIESCLPGFPLPPDLLLIAMCLTTPQKALLIALICTAGSVFGGVIGYSFGFWGGRPLFNYFFRKNTDKLEAVEKMYGEPLPAFALLFSLQPRQKQLHLWQKTGPAP